MDIILNQAEIQQTRDIDPKLVYCWASVNDPGPTFDIGLLTQTTTDDDDDHDDYDQYQWNKHTHYNLRF